MKESFPDFGLHSTKTLTDLGFKDATLLIKDGKIFDIVEGQISSSGFPIEDLGDLIVMPGIIDSHVHINEPGRTEWEGFETITKAAIAGGITTLVDMPLNSSPVTISAKTLQEKIKAA